MNADKLNVVKDETTVLLQDDRAIWCRWLGDRVIDWRVIPHDEDASDNDLVPFDGIVGTGYFRHPIVSLILDSSLDEVSCPSNTLAQKKNFRLSNDFDHIHESLNNSCQLWLRKVQEQGVVFNLVVSTLRLLLRSYSKGVKQTFIVVDDECLSRHVLCQRGCMVYARQCNNADMGFSHKALAESLEYLNGSASATISSDCDVVYIGTDAGHLELLKKQSVGSLVNETSITAAQWYFELFKRHRQRLGNRMSNRQLNRILNGQLEESESHRKMRASYKYFYLATCLAVGLASIMVVLAALHGISVAKYLRNIETQISSLSDEILLAKQSATAIHFSPVQAAESLARLELYKRIERLDATAVLTLIADAVTHHPEIKIDHLEWLTTDDTEALQWINVASLENAPVPNGINQVLRQSLDVSDRARIMIGTQIALEGSVRELTLRERQAVFEKFVRSLKASPVVASVEVVSSPLEYAVSSEVLDSDLRFSLQILHWPS